MHRIVFIFLKNKIETFTKVGLKIFKLEDMIVRCQESNVLAFGAKFSRSYFTEPNKIDVIDYIERIVTIVSNLRNDFVSDNHKVSHLFIIKIQCWLMY